MTLPSELFGDWLHAHEDDYDDVEVYRPASEEFPPARGREGFAIHRDGSFVKLGIAPADGTVRTAGQWEPLADDRLRITLNTGGTYQMELVSTSSREVHVRRRAGP
jgi:hypothetical protein